MAAEKHIIALIMQRDDLTAPELWLAWKHGLEQAGRDTAQRREEVV